MLKPYDFQEKIINSALTQVGKSDKRGTFVVSPPGSGKTLMMAEVCRRLLEKHKVRVLFFVHRTEIVQQAYNTFINQGIDPNLIKFGMVQTFTRREEELKKFNPQVIFVDEAHHAPADSYMRILNWFPKAFKFYFTATPQRADGKGFEDLVNSDDLVLGPSVDWLIKHDKLSDFDYYVKTLYDVSQLKSRKGDYTNKSIAEQAQNVNVKQIVDGYLKYGEDKPGVVYAATVEQSKAVVEAFHEAGITAEHLDGATDAEVRKNTLDDFKAGKIKIISNVQIFTEGVDLPDAAVALIARPTKSVALYYQFSMRVLRYKKGKRARIIDFAGVANQLGLPNANREWSLLSHDVTKDKTQTPILFTCPNCHKVFSSTQVKKDLTVTQNKSAHLVVSCPSCSATIMERTAEPKTPEMVELQEIVNKKEFSDNWYKTAKIARNQSLKVNARILQTQNPGLKNHDIFVQLLKLYLPDFRKNTPYNQVLSVKMFPEREVNSMLNYLKADKDEGETFRKMFEARKSIIVTNYINAVDLSKVKSDAEFYEMLRQKVKAIEKSERLFGEEKKLSKGQVMNELVLSLVENVRKNYYYHKEQQQQLQTIFVRACRLGFFTVNDMNTLLRMSTRALQNANDTATQRWRSTKRR